MIEHLPALDPDAPRGARTLARCREQLARRRLRLERQARFRSQAWLVERFVVAGVCVAYLVAMAGDIIRLYR